MTQFKARPMDPEVHRQNVKRIEQEVADLRSRGIEPHGCDYVTEGWGEKELMAMPLDLRQRPR